MQKLTTAEQLVVADRQAKREKLLELRDHFAGLAMSGDIANEGLCWADSATDEVIEIRTQIYYRTADAMLLAREQFNLGDDV